MRITIQSFYVLTNFQMAIFSKNPLFNINLIVFSSSSFLWMFFFSIFFLHKFDYIIFLYLKKTRFNDTFLQQWYVEVFHHYLKLSQNICVCICMCVCILISHLEISIELTISYKWSWISLIFLSVNFCWYSLVSFLLFTGWFGHWYLVWL